MPFFTPKGVDLIKRIFQVIFAVFATAGIGFGGMVAYTDYTALKEDVEVNSRRLFIQEAELSVTPTPTPTEMPTPTPTRRPVRSASTSAE